MEDDPMDPVFESVSGPMETWRRLVQIGDPDRKQLVEFPELSRPVECHPW